MTLEELQIIITAQTSGIRAELGRVNSQVRNMTSGVNSEIGKIQKLFLSLAKTVAAVKIGQMLVNSVKDAMKVEGALQQIKRIMGESSNSFLKWAQDNALAFNMSQSAAIQYGAIFSNLVSGFSTGTAQTSQYTTDLLKASSIIASGTGRTMEDVMSRIRSGLLGNTEAIEDLGVNVNVAMLQSTEAFKKFANGKSWDQLDFRTQQQIRLFGILEQTSSKFGGEVFNNTNSSLQQLVAILKDVALNIGNAFLPILNVVLPILSSFAMQLRTATSYVATFMQTLFGKGSAASSVSNATGALSNYDSALADTGDTAKSTAKEMNRLLGGFDEINSLSDSGASGGGLPGTSGTGGGISAVTPVIDNSGIDSSMMGLVDDIKGWFGSIDFSPLIDSFNRVKESISPIIDTIGNNIKWFVTEVLAPLAKWTIEDALPAFFNLLAGALDVLSPILDAFSRTGQWLWDNFLAPIAAWTGGVIVDVLNGLADVLSKIGDWMSDNKPVMENLALIIESIGIAIGIVKLAMLIHSGVMAIWSGIMWVATYGTTAFGVAMLSVSWPLVLIVAAIAAVIAIVLLLIKNWDWVKEVAIKVWDKIVEVWNVAADWFYNNVIQPLADFFSGLWDGIVAIFTGAVDWFSNIFNSVWVAIEGAFSSVGSFFSGLWNSIVSIFIGIKDWFSNKFSEAWEAIKSVFSAVGSFFGGIWDTIKQQFTNIGSAIGDAIGGAFKYVVNSIINFAENTINGFIRAINGAIGMINHIPGVNINTLNTMDIPRLAKGGIVDSAQMFVAGEAGKEAVMPLENNTGWITQLAEKVATRMPQGSDNSSISGDLILMIDGSVIGKVALSQLRKMQRQGNITLIPT